MATIGQRRGSALAGLALALLAAPALGAEPLPRLAATLVTPGHAAALLESTAGQSWVVPGEVVGECRLLHVDAFGASLGCGTAQRQLRLAPGDAQGAHPAAAAAAAVPSSPVMESAVISPAALRALVENPQASALGIDVVPVSQEGQVIGWTVSRLDPGSPVGATGLQQDDLVVAVDGAPARQPEAFMAALRAVPGANSFVLDLLRQGRPISLLVAVAAPDSH